MNLDCSSNDRFREPRSSACRTAEPGLEQLLKDPLIRLVMKSDGVEDADLRALLRPRRGEARA